MRIFMTHEHNGGFENECLTLRYTWSSFFLSNLLGSGGEKLSDVALEVAQQRYARLQVRSRKEGLSAAELDTKTLAECTVLFLRYRAFSF